MMTLYMYVCVQLFYYCYSAYVLDSLRSHLTSSTITTVQHIERFLQTIDPAITLKACAYKVSKLLCHSDSYYSIRLINNNYYII